VSLSEHAENIIKFYNQSGTLADCPRLSNPNSIYNRCLSADELMLAVYFSAQRESVSLNVSISFNDKFKLSAVNVSDRDVFDFNDAAGYSPYLFAAKGKPAASVCRVIGAQVNFSQNNFNGKDFTDMYIHSLAPIYFNKKTARGNYDGMFLMLCIRDALLTDKLGKRGFETYDKRFSRSLYSGVRPRDCKAWLNDASKMCIQARDILKRMRETDAQNHCGWERVYKEYENALAAGVPQGNSLLFDIDESLSRINGHAKKRVNRALDKWVKHIVGQAQLIMRVSSKNSITFKSQDAIQRIIDEYYSAKATPVDYTAQYVETINQLKNAGWL
jgi:hypothetical protein